MEETVTHIPKGLEWEGTYSPGHVVDERDFEIFDPTVTQPEFFLITLVRNRLGDIFDTKEKRIDGDLVRGLVQSLGRVPTPAEVGRERFRQQMFKQINTDADNPLYLRAEVEPREAIFEILKAKFPDPENPLEIFRDAPARIETTDSTERLMLQVQNRDGRMVELPVMTTEEIEWVKKSADIIARVMAKKEDSRIFIAGLGLGLLNRALVERGISLERQVVAELNINVIQLIGNRLQQDFGERPDLCQGDFKDALRRAIERKEYFDAISVDPFPNKAEEVGIDASNKEALELALRVLKPGGLLTFYPDSRYIPKRIYDILRELEIPDSSIHYTVARFRTSEFTQTYYYGELMAVVHIQKPFLGKDASAYIQV